MKPRRETAGASSFRDVTSRNCTDCVTPCAPTKCKPEPRSGWEIHSVSAAYTLSVASDVNGHAGLLRSFEHPLKNRRAAARNSDPLATQRVFANHQVQLTGEKSATPN